MEFETVIGLEIHAQMKTRSKIFCGCSTEFGAPPNTHTCPVCLGMPGSLPVLNRKVVESAIKLGLATDCPQPGKPVRPQELFLSRSAQGYQISQFDLPICEHGHIDIEVDGQAENHRHHPHSHGGRCWQAGA
jgi:aspartyl-tRNA(Asn)/glutamyl-tRNA(Gln) amidotransferase subunit B